MRILLDTHLVLWALDDDPRMPDEARALILDESNEVYVSSIAIWEIAIKSGLGKLDAEVADILRSLPDSGFDSLAFTAEHAAAVSGLPSLHRDPFDRAMVAQAQCEPLVLLTHDAQVAAYGSVVRYV